MRNFLEKLAWRTERFMQGRNGMDDLARAVYYVTIFLLILSLFVSTVWMNLLCTIGFAYAIFRTVSKKIDARQRENAWYLNKIASLRAKFGRGGNGGSGKMGDMWNDAKKKAEQQKLRFDERKEYKFFKCKCGATLRVHRGQGTKELTCPVCHEKMTRNTN